MSFDSHSLERLRELGRRLPKQIATPANQISPSKKDETKQHPIETEEDPNRLFKELINASKDGEIPKHLIDRLREVENQRYSKLKINEDKHQIETRPKTKSNKVSREIRNEQKEGEELYVQFKSLLLEED